MTQFAEARRRMVDSQLRTTDVTDRRILDAMGAIAREEFAGEKQADLAYLDRDIALGSGRFMMSPSAQARMIQAAAPQPTDRVLIVGAATGYGAAIVATMAGKVVALESDGELAAAAQARLASLANVEVVVGPLTGGAAKHGPFDLIIVEGAVPDAPEELFGQLDDRGRLVCAEGESLAAIVRVHVKDGPAVSARRAFNLAVPALPEFSRAPAFVF